MYAFPNPSPMYFNTSFHEKLHVFARENDKLLYKN